MNITIDAIHNLTFGVLSLSASLIIYWRLLKTKDILLSWACGFLVAFFGIVSVTLLFNPWNYIAIYDPELAQIHYIRTGD